MYYFNCVLLLIIIITTLVLNPWPPEFFLPHAEVGRVFYWENQLEPSRL